MNRADQTPEPSMEEILASIRSIIADDGKPPVGESAHAAPTASPAAPAEDDVLDLTEELVFPVERHATPAFEPGPHAAQQTEPVSQAVQTGQEAQYDAQTAGAQAQSPMERIAAHLEAPHDETPRADTRRPDAHRSETPQSENRNAEPPRAESPRAEGDPRESQPLPAQAAPRSIWSRRELPGTPPPAPASPAIPRATVESRTPRPQKRWTEDIHMPIPADGPIPLIPQDIQPRAEQPLKSSTAAAPDYDTTAAAEPEDSEMALLAERLARDAAGAMDDEELAQAGDVDFELLADQHKAEVTESFASAIERQSDSSPGQPLPSLLDEVLRHGFRRDAEEDQGEETEATAACEPDCAREDAALADDAVDHASANAAETAPADDAVAEAEAAHPEPETEHFREMEDARSEDLPSEEAEADEAAAEERRVEQEHFQQRYFEQPEEQRFDAPAQRDPRPDFAPWLVASPSLDDEATSEPDQEPEPEPVREEAEPPLAQARFMGAEPSPSSYASQLVAAPQAPAPAPSQPAAVPPTVSGPLEAAVREMLRPMLVQWLNENMPRILESAIRDEIAARGVFPKSDDQV
ncbi:DUF2497 domain-containing protein [Rhodomicrobium sp. Az07]|uniref:DUF2497 domain-containing protein n=1 Tax=Rhodomicrobium sp. Az07 TaxID=2839034 RepID=UPI001BE541E8|nr:DUF2497 domain-containing protein [Rhodomicrobium sp. Az07]MBT3070191.1 DUF2497 domain-containing protein [Rhodomicrobium sp. Az07]